MAMDPLAAIQRPAKCNQFWINADSAGILDRIAGAELIGDRADAADPRGEIRRFGVGAATQERLEKTRWLVDVELDAFGHAVAQFNVQGTLAFNSGQRTHANSAGGLAHSASGAPWRAVSASRAPWRAVSASLAP